MHLRFIRALSSVALWAVASSVAPLQGALLLEFGNATVTQSALAGVPVGSIATGTIRFDPAWPDSEPTLGLGVYYGAISEFTLDVGTLHLMFDQAAVASDFTVNAILVVDELPGGGAGDRLVFDLESIQLRLILSLADPSGTAATSDALPTTLAALNNFQGGNALTFVMADGAGNQMLTAEGLTISSLEEVPEPQAAWLMIPGLLGAFGLARRASSRSNS